MNLSIFEFFRWHNLSWSTVFSNYIPFIYLLSKECFILNKKELHATQSHWMSISVIGRPKKKRLNFFLLAWSCFYNVLRWSGLSRVAAACSGLLRLAPLVRVFIIDDFTKYFDLQIKWTSCWNLLPSGAIVTEKSGCFDGFYSRASVIIISPSFLVLRSRAVVLQSRTGITKWCNFSTK